MKAMVIIDDMIYNMILYDMIHFDTLFESICRFI